MSVCRPRSVNDASMRKYYGPTYFRSISRPSRTAAETILPYVDEALRPQSIVDVGCGAGAWLEVWSRVLGKRDILGIDGAYVDEDQLFIPKSVFRALDVGQRFELTRRFDLAMALEVGEHLLPKQSEQFVDNLVRLSDRVLFSAAPPGQGGQNHINERPYEYWKGQFETRGYRTFDYVRPHALRFPELDPWFRYNPLLYVRESACNDLPEKVLRSEIPRGAPVEDCAPMTWRVRRLILRAVPVPLVTMLSNAKHRVAVVFGGD